MIAGRVLEDMGGVEYYRPDIPDGHDSMTVLSIRESVEAPYVVRVDAPAEWWAAIPEEAVLWLE